MSLLEDTISDLKRHEGFSQYPYRDTLNVLTIGYGRNLEARGVTHQEAEYLLRNDVLAVLQPLEELSFWWDLNEGRQSILLNMAVNLGLQGLLGFKKMFAALRVKDYATAAKEMLDSKWAEQVPGRAKELAQRMEHGY